jgi:hypothetical protein
MLRNVQFIVRESGRQRVLQEGRKNVHAFARGYITGSAFGTDKHGRLPVVITYNPHVAGHFWEHTSGQWREELCSPVYGARCVILNKFGMTAAYLNEPVKGMAAVGCIGRSDWHESAIASFLDIT